MDRDIDYLRQGWPVHVPAGPVTLEGSLHVPEGAQGIVVLANGGPNASGDGNDRFSPRHRFVASVLQEARLATLLIGLLTPEEEAVDRRTHTLRFNIDLLAYRLEGATDWLAGQPETRDLNVGYYGAGTGAAAALVAASEQIDTVNAIVLRGGRLDLAGPILSQVEAPTLLIVGGRDHDMRRLCERAVERLRVEKLIRIVPDASHLFQEPGALEQVADLARDWFQRYLVRVPERLAIA